MVAHLKKRNGIYYLVDGRVYKSLHTTKKTVAAHLLREYELGKYGLTPTPTVGQFYEQWMAGHVESLYRRSLIIMRQQAFNAYILPAFADLPLSAVDTAKLESFRRELLSRGLSVNFVRNILNTAFRAMYRDARRELDALKGRDPFMDIRWPRAQQEPPDPFTKDEERQILNWFKREQPFYHPWVLVQFRTGMRPSESCALLKTDVDKDSQEIRIIKSRNLGQTNTTKTGRSHRTIHVPSDAMRAILALPSWGMETPWLWLHKYGGVLEPHGWAAYYWPMCLKALGIRWRKFYATRHTFITEMVRQGHPLKAIADYCGTSTARIEANYCGTLRLEPGKTSGRKGA